MADGGCINPAGLIVGSYFDATFLEHSFVRTKDGTITTFDVPGAGTGPFQGTEARGINPAGTIEGVYTDPSNVSHGFVRAKDGTITTFDAPGAGTGAGQGTAVFMGATNPAGATTGAYLDSNIVFHGFLRTP
jgi:hypothetical protein